MPFGNKMFKVVQEVISCSWNSISDLRDVTCHTESHSVTCHPTQVNTPVLNPSQRTFLDLLPTERKKVEFTGALVTYRDIYLW